MKQKVLKKLGLLALSGIMVAPNVLGGNILENNSKTTGKGKAYPKLSTKDAGKNPKKESTVKAKSGFGFFGKLFKLVGGVVVLNETHNLIRNLIGNPWFCLGMARGLFKQTTETGLTGKVLYGYERSEKLLQYFQRETEKYNQINSEPVQTKPVFQGVLTPMSKNEIQAQINAGKEFAKKYPKSALFILKRFDAMLAMGIDIFSGVKPFDSASPNPSDQMNNVPLSPHEGMDSPYIECNGFGDFDFSENN